MNSDTNYIDAIKKPLALSRKQQILTLFIFYPKTGIKTTKKQQYPITHTIKD